jgi:hypothetical protein
MKRNNSFQSIGQFHTQQNTRRRRILAMMLAAVVTASPIGLAPTASAKGIVLPRDTCSGPHIAAKTCTKPPQPVPAHVCCGNHGSRHRKIAIALAREARRAPTSGSAARVTPNSTEVNTVVSASTEEVIGRTPVGDAADIDVPANHPDAPMPHNN